MSNPTVEHAIRQAFICRQEARMAKELAIFARKVGRYALAVQFDQHVQQWLEAADEWTANLPLVVA